MLQGKCKKCGITIKIGQDGLSKEEVIEKISKWETFQCPGHHVELCGPYPHYWDLNEFEEVPDEVKVTEENWLVELKKKYSLVCDTGEFSKLNVLTSFAFGLPMTNDGKNWDFAASPAGKRYYYCN